MAARKEGCIADGGDGGKEEGRETGDEAGEEEK